MTAFGVIERGIGGSMAGQALVVVSVVLVLMVNTLANTLPLNGQTTGEIANRFPVYFMPAGYVFSIWGLIYLGLVAFAIYQALPNRRSDPRLRKVRYLFVLSCVANSAWIFLWHYEFFVSTLVAMVALLILLIAIYLRLDIGRARPSAAERWLVHVPFSIYLGWITVATITNVTTVLYHLQWDGWGFGGEGWAVIMLVASAAIATAMSVTRADAAYSLVILWAYVGIAIKQSHSPLVSWAALVMAILVALVTALTVRGRLGRPTMQGQ